MALLQRQQQFRAITDIASRLFTQVETLNNVDLPDGTGPNQLDLRDGLFMNQPVNIIVGDFVMVPGIILAPGVNFTRATLAPVTSLIIFQAKQIMLDDFLMTFVCAFDSDAVVNQLDLRLGTEFVIPHPIRVLELEDVFKTMFKAEISLFNLFHNPIAGGGPAPAAPAAPASHGTNSQQLHHSALENIQHLYSQEGLARGYPSATPGARTTAGQLQMGILEANLRHLIAEQGQMTHEKIVTTLSTAQLDAFITLNFNGTTIKLLDLIPKGLLEKYSVHEQIFLIGRMFTSVARLLFHIRFSIVLVWLFEENIRDLINFCATKLNRRSLLPLIEDKILNLRTLVIPPTPAGMDIDIHVINVYKTHLRFNRQDDRIQYILQNDPSSDVDVPTAGGGGATVSDGGTAVGDRRKRVSFDNGKAKKEPRLTAFSDWLDNSPLPDCRACWDWASNKAPCNGKAFCANKIKRDHHFPPGTRKPKQDEYKAWALARPK